MGHYFDSIYIMLITILNQHVKYDVVLKWFISSLSGFLLPHLRRTTGRVHHSTTQQDPNSLCPNEVQTTNHIIRQFCGRKWVSICGKISGIFMCPSCLHVLPIARFIYNFGIRMGPNWQNVWHTLCFAFYLNRGSRVCWPHAWVYCITIGYGMTSLVRLQLSLTKYGWAGPQPVTWPLRSTDALLSAILVSVSAVVLACENSGLRLNRFR